MFIRKAIFKLYNQVREFYTDFSNIIFIRTDMEKAYDN